MRAFRKAREYVPVGAMIIFLITIISAILFAIIRSSVPFADFFNYYISAPTRFIMAKITSWIPFSLAEALIISIPIWTAILVYIGIKCAKKDAKSTSKFLCSIFSIICFVFITFVWTYSSGYSTTTIDKRLQMDREKVSADELYQTALWLTYNINELSPKILYDETGASVMNYSYWEMSDKLCDAYDKFSEKYPILHTFDTNLKPIILSEPFTYTHISGIYTFMTGESNINVNYPDFIVASSGAHELAHQRGIAREDEANFVAFLVSMESDDPFIQYSGYLDVYQSVMSALYSADKDLYKSASSALCSEAYYDRVSYSNFFKKYADSKTSEVSNSINNSFLQANGQQQGTKSYGMVTDLTVAYYKAFVK
ncbi:MAG: DUF3810 domain-containing protein [Clostridia bacterium]|nr:DUF3810 domain-containing protein [Clostridia bacterium]